MIWERKNKEVIEGKTSKRSEEINDIIDKMPMTFGKWVARAVIFFFVLLLTMGWVIKYPDTVTGQIKINSNLSPVRLVANASGKMQLLNITPQENVKEGQYIAIIQNSATTVDVIRINNLIHAFDPNNLEMILHEKLFPKKVSLGELNLKYYAFLSALESYKRFLSGDSYKQQKRNLLTNIKWQHITATENSSGINISQKKLDVTEKWYRKYQTMNKKDAVAGHDVDNILNDFLSAKLNYQNLKKENASIQLQIAENEYQLNRLEIEQNEKDSQLQMELLTTYYDLRDNLKVWENKYIFKAPFTGKVEFLNFWVDNQFIQSGEEVFSIIPPQNITVGQMLLPASGAGKVKNGSNVIIKLNNFPYTEFGSINGTVASISLITKEQKAQESSIDSYLITVDLPQGLKTNYGEVLEFQYELGGIADIIIRDRRLIKRLFDNLKSRVK